MLRYLLTRSVYVEWTLAFVLTLIAAARLRKPEEVENDLARLLLTYLGRHYLSAVFFLATGILLLKIFQKAGERWTTDRKAVKAVLDSAHRSYFKGVPDGELYAHRVTLFRARRHFRDFPLRVWAWRTWPWHLWKRSLRIHCRSGTAYQRSATRWRVDDEDELANEGVAGRIWFTNAAYGVEDLPEWPDPTPPNPSTDGTCQQYARRCHLSVERAAMLNVKSRSVGGSIVRSSRGARWGVVVFDSRDPRGVSNEAVKVEMMGLTAHLLGQLV